MKRSQKWLTMGVAFSMLVAAQESTDGQHTTVQFRDPAAPKKVEISLMTAAANVTVRGAQRNDVAVDWTGNFHEARGNRPEPPPGMHRLGGSGSLDVTQDNNNVVRISGSRLMSGFGDVTIQVPAQASVAVSMALNGKVTVENVAGEIEVNHLNGDVTIINASGPVVAHSTNGKIVATLSKFAMGKAMSFSTFNGDIDVTLPADSKATLKARADSGDIFTDFDVKLEPRSSTAAQPAQPPQPAPPAPPAPPNNSSNFNRNRDSARAVAEATRQAVRQATRAASRIMGDGLVEGTINGGGTEIQFTTFNGRILIHKK